MSTLGILGGIGPESTIEYYRAILAGYRARHGSASAPSIVINSIDAHAMLGLFAAGRLAEAVGYLSDELRRLSDAGADLGIVAANTPHVVFDEVQARSPIPLVSIVTATRDAVQAGGWRRPGLFGTRFTMGGRFYPDVFARAGLEIVVPADADQVYIHDKYMTELLRNEFRDETRSALLGIVERMTADRAIDVLILGGTELPLLLRGREAHGIPLLDTTKIHAQAAVDRLWP